MDHVIDMCVSNPPFTTITSHCMALEVHFCVLTLLGMYSVKIAQIAQAFASILHHRTLYLKCLVGKPTVSNMVVCPSCHTLYSYKDCTEKRGDTVLVRSCSTCLQSGKSIALLKEVITSQGNKKLYPRLVYPV